MIFPPDRKALRPSPRNANRDRDSAVKSGQPAQIARLIVEKKVRVEIAKTFPLEKFKPLTNLSSTATFVEKCC